MSRPQPTAPATPPAADPASPPPEEDTAPRPHASEEPAGDDAADPVPPRTAAGEAPDGEGADESAPPPDEDPLARLRDRWDLVIRDCVVEGRAALAAALADRRLDRGADGAIELRLSLSAGNLERHADFLRQRLERELPPACRIRLLPAAASARSDDGRREAYREAERHPLVQRLRRSLQADIVSRERIGHDEWLRSFQDGD